MLFHKIADILTTTGAAAEENVVTVEEVSLEEARSEMGVADEFEDADQDGKRWSIFIRVEAHL